MASTSALSVNTLPRIIQGGMGIAVSSWRLARAVSRAGELGVISGTAIDSVMVRELQDGDPFNRIQALRAYPDQETVDYIIDRFYIEGGRKADAPYKLLPIHGHRPTVQSQRILSAAAFSEVYLAKEGHDGLVGINLLAELKRYTLPCLYGAMLAGVDAVMMGAGIPLEEAEQIPLLAQGKPARLRLEVDMSKAPKDTPRVEYELNPADIISDPVPLKQPGFFPIVASDVLARIMDKKLPQGLIAAWIVEGPVAGGHNAPPRNKQYDEKHNPVYDERDVADLERIAGLGYPFYLAGGYDSPQKLQEALSQGAQGVQIGSLFSLSDESGYPPDTKRWLIGQIQRREVTVRTDGRISPTGFPFKVLVVEGTNGVPEQYDQRTRICDLGYLQKAYVDEKGRLLTRCPSEPAKDYVRKGGNPEDAEGRGCLCNGLMANIGLGQVQKWGKEAPLFTGGDGVTTLPFLSEDRSSYTASEVIDYLYGRSQQRRVQGSKK